MTDSEKVIIASPRDLVEGISLVGKCSDMSSVLRTLAALRRLAERAPVRAGPLMQVVAECLLRLNPTACGYAGIFLRECFEGNLISIEDMFGLLERWERNPVVGFSANLGATVYEHFLVSSILKQRFEKWKEDPVLRGRFIEVGFCLPAAEQLDLYEWALDIGETNAVVSSIVSLKTHDPEYCTVRGDLTSEQWKRFEYITRSASSLPASTES